MRLINQIQKKNIFLVGISVFFLAVFTANFISASYEENLTYSTSSIVQIQTMKYDPYPVNPGEYFDFWISVVYNGNTGVNGGVFELSPSFPFSLDSNETATKSYPSLSYPSLMLKWRVRVSEDAAEGINYLTLNYKVNGIWYTKDFEIGVANAQTSFDAVLQDSSSSEVSIAIANTGKNTANSVIVKIPTQSNFEVTGTDGQMVGNLDSGDYSIVTFEVSQVTTPVMPSGTEGTGNPEEMNISNLQAGMQSQSSSLNLTFDIYYTDNIGVRRMVEMGIPVASSSNSTNVAGMAGGFGGQKRRSSIPTWFVIGIIVIALVVVFFILRHKFPKQYHAFLDKLSKIFRKKKKDNEPGKLPEWAKSVVAKEREKK